MMGAGKKAESYGEDRVLRMAIYVTAGMLLVGFAFLLVRMLHPRADGREGKLVLEKMESGDEAGIRSEIETLVAREEAERLAWENRPLEEKLKEAAYLGDFTLQPFVDYQFLEQDHAIIFPNILVSEENSGIFSEIPEDLRKKKKVFIFLGMNDAAVKTPEEEFKNGLVNMLDSCQKEMPEAEIYVNGLEAGQISFAKVSEDRLGRMNALIQEACDEKGAGFIDNHASSSEGGGREYYERWGLRMVEAGKL